MKHCWWLLLLITATTTAQNSTRIVVTFTSASYNTKSMVELIPENVTVVKQYGRRMVLDLGEESTSFIADALTGVERVESDSLVDTSGDFHKIIDQPTYEPVLAASELTPPPPPWHLDPLEPYGIHMDSTLKNASTVVAILDSGLAAVAPWRPSGGYCFITSPDYTNTKLGRNPDYTDPGDQGPTCPVPSWHGTKVASIVKAIAPNCKLSILRVLGRCGTGFASDVTDAIVWAAGGGINGVAVNQFPSRVISMSLAGKGSCPTYMQSAITQAIGMGATIIAAAGNAGANASLYFPGNCKGVLSIGASTRQGTLATYSNWGPTLALSAPGGDAANPIQVLTVDSSGSIAVGYAMGTSFAAPHVAGAAVLLQTMIPWNQGTQYTPFAQCDAPVCGEILSYVGMSDTVQASGTCTGSLSDSLWTIQAGFRQGGDSNPSFYCNAPCYVTRVIVCDRNGAMRSIQIQCSDGNYSPWFGYQGACDGSTGGTADSALGFTGITAYAGGDINGVAIWSIEGVKSAYGCAVCQNTYNMQCGFAPDNQKRVLHGIQVAYDSQWVHSITLLCYARRCADGFWYNAAVNDCVDCNRCGGGAYADGCGGSSMGNCKSCVSCPATQYQSGCGGTYGGWCFACTECSAGESFSGCAGGGSSNNFVCTGCAAGTYGGGGFATACTDCQAGKFTTSTRSTSCSACTVCPDGKFERQACTTTQDRQCETCGTCGPNQYRSGCTSTSSGGSCSNCQLCVKGKYLYDCTGRNEGSCKVCPEKMFCSGDYDTPKAWTWTTCPPGKYFSDVNSATMDGVCSQCPANNYCAGGTAASIPCPTGWYCSTDGSSKTICPSGSYCGQGVTTPTGCAAGYYSTASGASSISTCQQCEAGKKAASIGSSACALCLEGTSSATGAVSCTDCTAGTSYQDLTGQSGCKTCNIIPCAAGTVAQACTAKTDKSCTTCASIANCKYSGNICTDINGKPTCACAAGYQMVGSQCQQCPYGKFKAQESTNPCASWRTLECTSSSLGTRVKDSECVEFPPPPDNALAVGESKWECNAGFELYK